MNTGKTPDESLYSGGLEGNSVAHVALYDATFHPSIDWNHAASLLYLIEYKVKENSVVVSLLGSGLGLGLGLIPGSGPVLGLGLVLVLGLGSNSSESWTYFLPYIILVKTNGGPDHNIKHISNFLSMVALFILGGMYRLVAIKGCPVLSFQNIAKQAMYILNLSISNLALKID